MRRIFAESSSPKEPGIALDKLVEALRDAAAAALVCTPRLDFEQVVAELECSFDNVERAVTIAAAPLDHASRRVVGEVRAFVAAMLPLELFRSSRAMLPSKERHVMGDADAPLRAVDGDDVCLLQEHDLAAVDALDGCHRQLGAVNSAVNELKDASLQRDVTASLLARANLAWDVLDADLRFLAATSRNAAGDLPAQSGRLAERLRVYEREDEPHSSGDSAVDSQPRARARRFDHCLMVRSTRTMGRKYG